MTRVKTSQAAEALALLVRANAEGAAGRNDLVARREQKRLDPFALRHAQAIREEGGKGARVSTEALAERSLSSATAAWEAVNPSGAPTGRYLSKAEVAQVAAADPQLGVLTQRAYLIGAGKADGSSAAVQTFFDAFDFTDRKLHQGLPSGARIDARPGQPGRTGVPESVLESFDYYYRAEASDWASVSLQKSKIAGEDFFIIYMTTDGDDGYLETYDASGKPVQSARIETGDIFNWDEFFGRAKLSATFWLLDEYAQVEGLSEPEERIAAGQLPLDWTPDKSITAGQLTHDHHKIDRVHLPLTLTPQQRELAYAGLEKIFEQVLVHRAEPGEPLDLGPTENGTLRLGTFVQPGTGKTFEVADWRDIDDGSFTFYFERDPKGRLHLAIEQFDN